MGGSPLSIRVRLGNDSRSGGKPIVVAAGLRQFLLLSGVYVSCGWWKFPSPAGEPRLMLLCHMWLHLNYNFYENHVFWGQTLGKRLLFFIVLPESRKFPSCSVARQPSELPPVGRMCRRPNQIPLI